jgi:putative transcriptional regulator
MDSVAGKLLVAAADLTDPNFARTVVLVVDHDDEGAFGLVLNRAAAIRLDAAWEQWMKEPCAIDAPVMIGGPVSGPPVALHTDEALADQDVVPGVYFARSIDLLLMLVADEAEPLRVFAGYAGWGPGQLESEIEGGSWGVTAATHGLIFGDEATLWDRVTRHLADERLITWLRVRHAPERPDAN